MRGHVKESLEYLKGLWSFRHSIRSVSFSGKMSQSDSDYVGTNGPVDRENCSLDFVEIDLLTTSIRFVRMFRCWRTALIDSVAAVDRRRDIGPWKANNWTNTVIDNTLPNTNNENKSDTSRHQQSTGRLSQTLRWHGKEGRTRGCDGGGGRSAFGSGSQDRPIGRGNCKFVPIWPSLSLSPRRPLCVDVSGVESTLTSNPKAWNLSTAAPTPAAGVKIISRQFGRNHPARRLGAAPWGGRSCGGGVGGGPKGGVPFWVDSDDRRCSFVLSEPMWNPMRQCGISCFDSFARWFIFSDILFLDERVFAFGNKRSFDFEPFLLFIRFIVADEMRKTFGNISQVFFQVKKKLIGSISSTIQSFCF